MTEQKRQSISGMTSSGRFKHIDPEGSEIENHIELSVPCTEVALRSLYRIPPHLAKPRKSLEHFPLAMDAEHDISNVNSILNSIIFYNNVPLFMKRNKRHILISSCCFRFTWYSIVHFRGCLLQGNIFICKTS